MASPPENLTAKLTSERSLPTSQLSEAQMNSPASPSLSCRAVAH